MRWSSRAALAALSLALITACAPKPEQRAGAPAARADQVITAADLPRPRPGYWERSVSTSGGPARVSHFCQSSAPVPIGDVGRGCSAFTYKRTFLGQILIDAACSEGPISTTLHVAISGDFKSSYVTDGAMTLTLQGHPPQRFVTHAEARYLGADCPPGETGTD
jgi:hypothetical protein